MLRNSPGPRRSAPLSLSMIAALFFGCETNQGTLVGYIAGGGSPPPTSYAGNWDWLGSIGGIDGRSISPATEGYRQSLTLSPDGSYRFFRGGLLVSSGHYLIKREKSPFTADSVDILHRDQTRPGPGLGDPQIVGLQGPDTLSLHDTCIDCYAHTYRRIK